MNKLWLSNIFGFMFLLLSITVVAEDITAIGQFEGAYSDNLYRFVTQDGTEIPAVMKDAGKIMSYTPFSASGYITHDEMKRPVFVIQKIFYDDRKPNQKTVSYLKEEDDNEQENRQKLSIIDRDAGYFQGPVRSDVTEYYQINPGNLTMEDLADYSVIWNLQGLPVGAKVFTVGKVLSTVENGLMNFRTAKGTNILINLNGNVVPMGQRVIVFGQILTPSILTIYFVNSMAS